MNHQTVRDQVNKQSHLRICAQGQSVCTDIGKESNKINKSKKLCGSLSLHRRSHQERGIVFIPCQ